MTRTRVLRPPPSPIGLTHRPRPETHPLNGNQKTSYSEPTTVERDLDRVTVRTQERVKDSYQNLRVGLLPTSVLKGPFVNEVFPPRTLRLLPPSTPTVTRHRESGEERRKAPHPPRVRWGDEVVPSLGPLVSSGSWRVESTHKKSPVFFATGSSRPGDTTYHTLLSFHWDWW